MIKMIKNTYDCNDGTIFYFTSSEKKNEFLNGEIHSWRHYYGEDHIKLVYDYHGNMDVYHVDELCPQEEVEEKGKILSSYEWYTIREDRINPPGGFLINQIEES